MIREQLEQLVREALKRLGVEAASVGIERPGDIAHGDFATNAALAYSKMAGIAPRTLAENIVREIEQHPHPSVRGVEIAGPGFVNFFLTDDAVRQENAKEKSTPKTIYSGKNILVEHSSLNLFKPFHIGHLVNNIIGEFVTRAMKVGGGVVSTLSFPSDISLGIAKGVFMIKQDGGLAQDIFSKSEEEIVRYLGDSYVRGTAYFKDHPEEEHLVKDVAQKLYTQTPSEEFSIYSKTSTINNHYFVEALKSLGSTFDGYIYESEAGVVGKEIVEKETPAVFTQSEGATVYIPDESRKDINTAVFINSQGNPTYEAKDVGLLALKFERYHPDVSLFVTDHEQESHFRVVLDAVSKFHPEWAEKSHHIPHGRMLLKGQKMSSRLGGIPLALDMIALVEEEVQSKAGEKIAHLSAEEKKNLEHEIALSALRVAVLRSKPGININFDPETSLSFEGDSGPYLLYTHARSASLLEKGKEKGYAPQFSQQSVTVLERVLAQYEGVLCSSIEEIAPQKLVTYLFDVAQHFNGFYAHTQIIGDDKAMSEHYLAIVKRMKAVLHESLWVLGITAPERM